MSSLPFSFTVISLDFFGLGGPGLDILDFLLDILVDFFEVGGVGFVGFRDALDRIVEDRPADARGVQNQRAAHLDAFDHDGFGGAVEASQFLDVEEMILARSVPSALSRETRAGSSRGTDMATTFTASLKEAARLSYSEGTRRPNSERGSFQPQSVNWRNKPTAQDMATRLAAVWTSTRPLPMRFMLMGWLPSVPWPFVPRL